MRITIIFLVGLVLACISSIAQDVPDPNNFSKLTQVLNPSPDAASIGKYGGIPINLSSGALNLDIPVYTLSSYNLSLPISLLYNSNSIRVNDLSSNVGMSWALNAGGVITRTVYGMPDDFKPRQNPPASYRNRDTSYINWLNNIGLSSQGVYSFDGQPDLFSFSFGEHNGKFILDSTLATVQLLTYSGLKIESRFAASDSNYNFKITDVDGVQYLFGGIAIEKIRSQEYSTNGSEFNQIPSSTTSYYLYKIIHPNNDTISISYLHTYANYIDNVSETMYGYRSIASNGVCQVACPAQTPSNTYVRVYNTCITNGAAVQSIVTSSGAKMVFNYISRRDCTFPILSSINVYQPRAVSPYKVFHLDYQYSIASDNLNVYQTDSSYRYRPFLKDMIESDPDSTVTKFYRFGYNDINSLPARLSYAQDHYGFYNGKTSNATLLPQPTLNPGWRQDMQSATADRNVDSVATLKGLLTSVTYPTGGKDSMVYESNYVFGTVAVTRPDTMLTAQAFGSTRFGTPVYDTIVVEIGQTIHLVASCFYTQDPPSNPDPAHDLSSLSLYNTGANQYLIQETINPGGSYNSLGNLYLSAGTYILKLQASGSQVSAESSVTYIPGPVSYQHHNILAGGNRVKKVISVDPINNAQNVKCYFYGTLNALTQSSSTELYFPTYERSAKFYYSCGAADNDIFNDLYQRWDFPCLYSNTQVNLCGYGSSPVSYASVTESFGENFENGGIEHKFTQYPDLPGEAFQGDFQSNAPRTSYSYVNGREISTYTFKPGANGFQPVKKVLTNYRQDTRRNLSISSYVDVMNYIIRAYYPTPSDVELGAFNLTIYQQLQNWIYADTVLTIIYDQSGIHCSSDTVVAVYGNPDHALPTGISSSASDGRRNTENTFRPQDITLTGNAETARQALVSNHILAAPLKSQFFKGTVPTYNQTTDYNIFSNGKILPKTLSLQVGSNATEKRVEFYKYNQYGKVIEQSKESDVKHTYIWDYNNLYLIAAIVNGDSVSSAYTSFEADGTGSWTVGGGARQPGGITGSLSYNLSSGNISRSGLTPGNAYILSYWIQGASPLSITGTMTGYPIQGKTVVKDGTSWTYFEHKISGQSSVSIFTPGIIDELRLYPAAAQMTTYTYLPLVGMSSQCDISNRVTYYEYDGMARLKMVKDQDGNVVKTIEYHYRGNN